MENNSNEEMGSCQNPTCRKYLYSDGEYCDQECRDNDK